MTADIVERWTLGGYAPGNYRCKCATCDTEFTGDKRAIQCLSCAGKHAAARIEQLEEELSIWKSVFPDIAPERVLPDRSLLEARVKQLEAALRIIAGDLHTSWQGDIARAALEAKP